MLIYRILFILVLSSPVFASVQDSTKFFTTSEIQNEIESIREYILLVDSMALEKHSKEYKCHDEGGTMILYAIDDEIVKIEFGLSYEYFDRNDFMIYFRNGEPVAQFQKNTMYDPGCGDPDRELEEPIIGEYGPEPEYFLIQEFLIQPGKLKYNKFEANFGINFVKWYKSYRDFGLSDKNYKEFFGRGICD